MEIEMIIPAIVLVACNRIESFKRLLSSVLNANYSRNDIPLIISIDHSNMAGEIKKIADEVLWKYGTKRVIAHSKNIGLKEHILSCGDMSESYGAVVILEDDLIVSDGFYSYVFQAINHYKNDNRVAGVSLYTHAWNGYAKRVFQPQKNSYDVFWGQFSISWGQCWTNDSWKKFRFWLRANDEGSLPNVHLPHAIENFGKQSWGKLFAYYLVDKDLYYIIPYVSLSTNFSDPGVHTKFSDSVHQVMLTEGKNECYRFPNFEDAIVYDIFFERRFVKDLFIAGINLRDVSFDLYGLKWNYQEAPYLASVKKYISDEPIMTFGIKLRPLEQNIIKAIPGRELFIYETSRLKEKSFVKSGSLLLTDFYLYDYSMKIVFKYAIRKLMKEMMRINSGVRRRVCKVISLWR